MTEILLKFASTKTRRNLALRDIADEIGGAFDAVRTGLGTRIVSEARAKFPGTPINFSIDISEYAPQQSGNAQFTLVWGALEQGDDDPSPGTVYGYFLDLLMDLKGTTITVQQFKNAVRNRWDLIAKRKVMIEAWKRAKNGDATTEINVTDTPTGQVLLVRPEFPKHKFASEPESEAEESSPVDAMPTPRRERGRPEEAEALGAPSGRRRNNEDEDDGS